MSTPSPDVSLTFLKNLAQDTLTQRMQSRNRDEGGAEWGVEGDVDEMDSQCDGTSVMFQSPERTVQQITVLVNYLYIL